MRRLPPHDRPFAELVARELDPALPADRPAPTPTPTTEATNEWLRDPPRDLFGIALSGGGIRSATFNLGLLQGLESYGLLRCFDYISTVSGGGYIGSFWTAWRKRHGGANRFPSVDTTRSHAHVASLSEPAPIRRLREYGNFLNPRLGILSFDTGRIVAALFASMVPTIMAAGALIALATYAWLGIASALLGPSDWRLSVAAMVLLTLAFLALSEVAWQRKERSSDLRAYTLASTVAAAVAAALWMIVSWFSAPLSGNRLLLLWTDAGTLRLLLAGPAAWFVAAVALVFVRFIAAAIAGRNLRSTIDRVLSRLLFAATIWLVVCALWLGARSLSGDASIWAELVSAAGTGAIGLAITRLHSFFARQPNKPAGSRLSAFLKPRLPQLLSYVFVGALTVLVMAAMSNTAVFLGPYPVLFGAILITLAILLFFEPNEVGLHAFYRGRLARAFLGAAGAQNDTEGRFTEPQQDDDIPLDKCPRSAPLHLVCCAANDLTTEEQFKHLHRGADSAVFSPVGFSVGPHWAPWSAGSDVSSLADAITASAAAFNSQMGSWSVKLGPAAVFALATLNLRLGMWWPHPNTPPRRRWLRGLPFYKEMLGRTSAGGYDVHLSDGGHFENMALYELVRRHCRYIIASDCGADPDVAFDDLGNLVRRVREDFNVEISIDLSPLRPLNGRATQPMVAGDIQYPDGDTGVLLLFKPTLIGDEPADVTQYSKRNATFPHESTGDQFYDEAQWESYRRLGQHAARSAFRFLTDAPSDIGVADESAEQAKQRCAGIFARARFGWTPPPQGFVENVDRITACHAGLDGLLRLQEADLLRYQVFRDVAELDGSRQGRAGITDVMKNVPLLREAIRQMEQIFHLAQLGRHAAHPINLGTMNVFGRWAGSALFRDWWPMLRSLYSAPFTSFLEQRFGLQPHFESSVVMLSTDAERSGFAFDSLTDSRAGKLDLSNKSVLALCRHAAQGNAGQPAAGLQLAVLLCEQFDNDGRVMMSWDADNFYVPPGLWGMGIGNQFLTKLGELNVELWVRIRKPQINSWTSRKTAADLAQMYRSAGYAGGPVVNAAENRPLPAALLPIENWRTYRWLYRRGEGRGALAVRQRTATPLTVVVPPA
jgi:hypothetical protein